MDLYSKLNSALSESAFKDVPKVNEDDHPSGLSYMGQWHAIKWIDSKPHRDTVQNLIFDEHKIYLAFKDATNTDYSVPGGSKDISYSDSTQVSIETREEAHIEVSDIKFTGLEYSFELPNGKPPIKSQMVGKYVSLYISNYRCESNAIIDPSMTPEIFKNGKFYEISEVFEKLRPEHKFGVIYYYMNGYLIIPQYILDALSSIDFNSFSNMHCDPSSLLKRVMPIEEATKTPSNKKKSKEDLDEDDFEVDNVDDEDAENGNDSENDDDSEDDSETDDDDSDLDDDDFELDLNAGDEEDPDEDAPDQNDEEEQETDDDGENKPDSDDNGEGDTDTTVNSDDTDDENNSTDDTLTTDDFDPDKTDNSTGDDSGDTTTDNDSGSDPDEGDSPDVSSTDNSSEQEGAEDDGSVNVRVNILGLSEFEKTLANHAMFIKWIDLNHKVEAFKSTVKDNQMKIEDELYDDIIKAVDTLLDNIDVYYKYKYINYNYEENIKNYAIFTKSFNSIISTLNNSLEK